MPVIPNAPDCRFSFPFHGLTSDTLVHALKVRVDGENGSLNGDVISGDIELDSVQGQIDVVYRIRDRLIDFFVTRKGDFVDCKKVAELLRQMVDEAVIAAKNDPNPAILEFDDDDAEEGDGDSDDDEAEVSDPMPRRPSPARPPPQAAPRPVSRSEAQIQAVRKDLGAMDPDLKRKLIISSAVVIVAIAGFIWMGRAPKET